MGAEIFTFEAINKIWSYFGGLGLASGFITLNLINSKIYLGSFSNLPVGILTSFILICIIAPFFEELFFSSLIMQIKKSKIPFIVSSLLTATLFSLFHLLSYGVKFSAYNNLGQLFSAFQATGGLFFGAFLFRLGGNYINEKSGSITGSTIAHILVNTFLFLSTSQLVFFG